MLLARQKSTIEMPYNGAWTSTLGEISDVKSHKLLF